MDAELLEAHPEEFLGSLGRITLPAVRRQQGPPDHRLDALRRCRRRALRPRVADVEMQITDQDAVQFDHDIGRGNARLGEIGGQGLHVVPTGAEPATYSGRAPERDPRVAIGRLDPTQRQPLGPARKRQPIEGGLGTHGSTVSGQVTGRRCRPPRLTPAMKTFEELWAELTEKAQTRPEGSGTVAALDAGVHQIGKKLVEEAAEAWMAAEHEGHERAAEEISQLLYHAQVLMIAAGISLNDVYSHL